MTEQNPMMAKIAKLLKLANNAGATPAEAASAAAKVQELLQEYGLTLAQIEDSDTTTTTRRDRVLSDRRARYLHQQLLMAALAENNFCLHTVRDRVFVPFASGSRKKLIDGELVRGAYEKRHLLVGRPHNIEATVMVYDYLIEAMKRCAVAAGLQAHKRSREIIDFYDGAVAVLIQRLSEQRREAEAASIISASGNGSHRELVLSDVYGTEQDLNNDALNGFPAGTTAARRRANQEQQARQQQQHDDLVAAGVDSDEAWYRAYGYDEDRAREMAASWRRGRSGRARRGTGWSDDYYRKVNSASYRAGKEAGSSISLAPQIEDSPRAQIGGR